MQAIIVQGDAKEIAALVVALQGRQSANIKLLVDGVEINQCPQGSRG